LYSKHNRHSKHHHDLDDVVEEDGGGAYYPRYKIVDYDEDNLKMKLIRVYPRIVGSDGGIDNDNGDIGVVDDDGDGGRGGIDNDNGDIGVIDDDGDGDRKGDLKMKIVFDSY